MGPYEMKTRKFRKAEETQRPPPSSPQPGTQGGRDITRERLLTAARSLFVGRGYHLTRPQDIARLAGLGHGTFYLYFADKQACFLAFVAAAQQELDQFLQPRLSGAGGLETYLSALIDGLLDYGAENPGVLRTAVGEMSAIPPEEAVDLPRHWAEGWARGLRGAALRGAIAGDYDPDIIGAIMVGAIGGAVTAASRGADRKDVIANARRFLMRALKPGEEIRSRESTHATK
jgi:AcrR family transcriptional regulator